MKKNRIALVMLVLALLLGGCGGAKMDITASSSKAKIQVNDAEDGTFAEVGAMYVSKGDTVSVASSLTKGKLKIEFCEAISVANGDEADEYVAGALAASVEVDPGETVEVPLESSRRYVVQVTTIGQTEGTVQITIK